MEDEVPKVNETTLQKYGGAIILYSITVVMVLARSIDFVLYIRMATKMANYEYILADILLSIGFMMGMKSSQSSPSTFTLTVGSSQSLGLSFGSKCSSPNRSAKSRDHSLDISSF